MFSAYIENPDQCKFEGQDNDEKVILLLRAHLITNLSWIFSSIVLFLLPFVVVPLLPLFGLNINIVPLNYQIALLIIDYLLVLIIVFEGFLSWYFNVYIVTDKRVVDVDFDSVLRKGINLAPLVDVEETDSLMAGIFGTIFNFGNVAIQTAGAKIAIIMKNIPNPALVSDFILDHADKLRKEG